MPHLARAFLTQVIAVIISLWLIPFKILFDSCFGIVGGIASIVIEVVSMLTDDRDNRGLNFMLTQSNDYKPIRWHRRKHYSADDVPSSIEEKRNRLRLNPVFGIYQHASDSSSPSSCPSSPPLLKRSETLRGSMNGKQLNQRRKPLCNIHDKSDNTHVGSFVSQGEIKKKCTGCLKTSGGSWPSLNPSSKDGHGRSIRVKVNNSLKDRREMQQLERHLAKLERRRHKSGELREIRRKEQEQKQMRSSLEDNKEDIETTTMNGRMSSASSTLELGALNNEFADTGTKEPRSRYIDGQSEDEGYGSLGRSTGSKINLQVQSTNEDDNSTSGSSGSRNLDNHNMENFISFLVDDEDGISLEDQRIFVHRNMQNLNSNTLNNENRANSTHVSCDNLETLQRQDRVSVSTVSKNYKQKESEANAYFSTDSTPTVNNKLSADSLVNEQNPAKFENSKGNVMNSDSCIVTNENVKLTKGMSLSAPEFGTYFQSLGAKTTGCEKAEEHDLVMPLPIFPKSRRWKSCNALASSMIFNSRQSTCKSRHVLNISTLSTNQTSLKPEITQGQEQVTPLEKSLGECRKIDPVYINSNVHYLNGTIKHGCGGKRIALESSSNISNNTEQSFNDRKSAHKSINSVESQLEFESQLHRSVVLNQNDNDSRRSDMQNRVRSNCRKIQNKNQLIKKKEKGSLDE